MGGLASRYRQVHPEPRAPSAREEYSSGSGSSRDESPRSTISTPKSEISDTGSHNSTDSTPRLARAGAARKTVSTGTSSTGTSQTGTPRTGTPRSNPQEGSGRSQGPISEPDSFADLGRLDPGVPLVPGLTPEQNLIMQAMYDMPRGPLPVPAGADRTRPIIQNFGEGGTQIQYPPQQKQMTEQEGQEWRQRFARMGFEDHDPRAAASGASGSRNDSPRRGASSTFAAARPPKGAQGGNQNPRAGAASASSGSQSGPQAGSANVDLSRETRREMKGFLDRKPKKK